MRATPRVQMAGKYRDFLYAARLGVDLRRGQSFGASRIGNSIFFAASAGMTFLDQKLMVGPEVFGHTVLSSGVAFTQRATPFEGLFGAHYRFAKEWRAGAGLSRGLSAGFGSPAFRVLSTIDWAPGNEPPPPPPDRDGDGVVDALDACPDVAGVESREPSLNGCPPDRDRDGIVDAEDACLDVPGVRTAEARTNGCPPDRDGDGVIDAEDACADVPGVKTGRPETNGCPPDRDGDGIIDAEDACADVPGVKTSEPKTNGCPPDRDGDGILDADDACADVPGRKTDDPKTNGCPDPDRDNDGILNEVDACPDDAGKPDKDPKRNGCPKAYIKGAQIKILDQVKFKTASYEILPGKDSQQVLEAVLAVLTAHPEVKKVRIEGHTDDRGSAQMNRKLSADRAASVVKWLVSRGID
ncbi:MAG: OmpA family protein, partial [Myxococcales bacterium]